MVDHTGEAVKIEEVAPAREEATELLAENLLVLRAQVRELVVRFGIEDPELLAVVLKVTPEEASALLGGPINTMTAKSQMAKEVRQT